MIERYSLSPMKELWGLEAQYERWLEVELAVVKTFEERGMAPEGTYDKLRETAEIDVDKILEIEEVTRHDVIAFIKGITENMGDEARYFHMGMTSSDVVDTAWSLGMKEAMEMIIARLDEFIDVLKKGALKYKQTVTLGRTHGIHAEPTSFGLKWLSWLSEAQRSKTRLEKALHEISQGKISGAVGNYANISPEVEKEALEKIGLRACECSTQVVPRDVHSEYLFALALMGALIERISIEVRHLQKSEVQEAQEPFRKGQRGSSAMPHKKNPIISERLCGMARLLRSNADASVENIALWHERDISHSSIERVIIPDSCMIAYYMLDKIIWMMDNLVVNEDQMLITFERSFHLVYSQKVMLALIGKGMSREEAYKMVQREALDCWNFKSDFKDAVMNNSEIREYLDDEEINTIFNPDGYLKNVDEIYKRFDFGELK
ncbi:MAG TPA: adenylosuccinate lyase [Thermotogota bacterium]|nr:adenylosuccinate lyase [Thermotogota bacterium]HPR96347.1 adenylosuccinate lyase [Thermotogota bacterium]